MECPYCGKEMQRGRLGTEGSLIWFPESEQNEYMEFPVRLTRMMDMAQMSGFFCLDCRKMILDAPEPVVPLVDRLRDIFTAEGGGEETARKKKEEINKKKREKDPWE